MVFDEDLLGAGPLSRFPSATGYTWSEDNAAELASGWIVEAADHPTDGELLKHARAVFDAVDKIPDVRMPVVVLNDWLR